MSANDEKLLRCKDTIVRCNMRLQTYIRGAIYAPKDEVSKFCKRAAQRKLRHIIKLAGLVRYYQHGGLNGTQNV